MIAGEKDLSVLLASMNPELHEGEYVFTTADPSSGQTLHPEAVCTFRENEGLTVILPRTTADRESLAYEGVFRWITLSVHSHLEAIGFLAAVTGALAEAGISVNAVSAFFHDHLFVPLPTAARAMDTLKEITMQHREDRQAADPSKTIAVVRAWVDAVNRRALDDVLAHSDPDIEIVGPRGSGRGHALLSEWMGNTRVVLETFRTYGKGHTLVAQQHGAWSSVATGEFIGRADIVSLFRVRDDRVVLFARYRNLDEALKTAGLTESNRIERAE